jgi:hypothetical protein
MREFNSSFNAIIAFAVVIAIVGCTKSDSGSSPSSDTSGGGSKASAIENEAQAAALAEIQKHWVKGPEGWTTARDTGSSFAPIKFLRQMREIAVQGVESNELGESDRLNGIAWEGQVNFKPSPCREAGDDGFLLEGMSNLGVSVARHRGRWTQWADFQPESIRLHKAKGKWEFQQDTWLLRGTIPQPGDYANAGVK